MSTDTEHSDTEHSDSVAAALTVPVPVAGRAPVAPPAAGYIGALLAVALVVAGCIAVRDSMIAAGWLGGSLWIDAAIGWIDGLIFAGWMIAAAVGLLVIGGWMLYSALRPRRKTAVQVEARSAIWIKTGDLARAASSAAQTVPGVLEASSRATRRAIVTTVHTTDPADPSTAETTREAVRSKVAEILVGPPKVVVRMRKARR